MKIKSLEIEAFGPFKSLQKIDFGSLTSDGLFMLEGPTGAGKSSIIDAIVWVLYGQTAHQAAVDGASSSYGKRVRSDYAAANEETKVKMEFSAGGSQYRIQRTAAYETAKVRGDGTRTIPASARLEFPGKSREALTRIDEIAREIGDILQMNADQFSQLVVLPQGDFASFLHASSDQRQDLLKKIFKTTFYEGVENRLRAKKKAIEDQLINLRNDIKLHAKNLINEAKSLDFEIDEKDLMSILLDENESSTRKINVLADIAKKILPDSTKDKSLKESLKAKIDPLRASLVDLEKSKDLIIQKDEALEKLSGLEEQEEEFSEYEDLLKLARKAANLQAKYENLQDIERLKEEAFGELDQSLVSKKPDWVKGQLTKLEPELRLIDADLAKYESVEEDIENLDTQIDDSSYKESLIKSIPALKTKVKALTAQVASQKIKIDGYAKKRKDGYAHLIKLTKGKPCPVCGSTEHPSPIKSKSPFDEEVLDEMNERLTSLRDLLKEKQGELKEAEETKKRKFVPAAKLREQKRLLSAAQNRLNALENKRWELGQEVELLRLNEKTLIDYTKYSGQQKSQEKALKDTMKVAGIEDFDELEELLELDTEAMQEEIKEFNQDLVSTRKLLEQAIYKKLPKSSDLSNQLETKKGQLTKLESEFEGVSSRIAESKGFTDRIQRAVLGVKDTISNIERVSKDGAPYLDLDKWVSGKNSRGLTLSNFVLQERLEIILEQASLILRRISNGRYEFRMNEDKVGRQRIAGLGISIMDYSADKERPAETLSGGETFYASLSLALGMAEVIKASQGGIEIGTLFIDEGFGSLSDDTLEEVLDVLEDLRSNDRIIGIISHVESMKTQIPLRLEVRPSDEGPSTVRMAVANQG